eukprot:TRINITY_DN5298_c0_g1_i1.p1 TRINITY_DN5298_c0_g1~~TRINITY_DN5298_c0_g1_i1.p1  ORF type:complete len:151 (-),score=23.30 TRINITY_DN5298_c0_g1_i1:239-691(-)
MNRVRSKRTQQLESTAQQIGARNGQSNRNGRVPVIGRANSGDTHHRRNGRSPPTMTVVLCDDVGETDHNVSKKRKAVQSLKTVVPAQESKEIKLTCAICMNAMEQETSTVCGHIFCKSCITSAIQLQKKCPTCRRKLTMSNIHRIYLSSA